MEYAFYLLILSSFFIDKNKFGYFFYEWITLPRFFLLLFLFVTWFKLVLKREFSKSFILVIKDKIIEEVKFYTKGCIATIVCGSMTAQLALGKTIDEALGISPREVIEGLSVLSEDHGHCSILAVSTLHRAIANFLLKR